MRQHLSVVILVFSLWLAVTAQAEVKVYFSPKDGCEQAILDLAHSAKMKLDAACYNLTSAAIADELLAAQKRGVTVRVILDSTQTSRESYQWGRLLAAGISLKINSHKGFMQNNFLVADAISVATGSYGWNTKATVDRDDANLVVFTNEAPVAGLFAAEFDRMWGDPEKFKPLGTLSEKPQATPKRQPGNEIVFAMKTETNYHRPWCQLITSFSIPITRAEAEAKGYTSCRLCKS